MACDFVESHNHDCLDPRLVGFLPTHRKMAEADASQMNNMKDAGISTPHIYAMLANQAGGYENVNYSLRDMYNEIARRRRHVLGDAREALRYLKNQKAEDTNLYYKWFGMVEEFGVAEKNWIIDMYEKRHMWATAHIREHFKRCLTYLRYKEVEADYVSISGLPVLKTTLEHLERSASNFYTREIFFIFRGMLVRAARMKVVQDVAFDSFVLMDSFGIPCEHIVCVLVFLNILELPKSLVLTRWSKNAKTSTFDSSGVTWESIILSQYGCLMDWCRQLSYVTSRRQERFHLVRDTVMSLIEDFKIEDEQEKQVGAEADDSDGIFPKNPQNCRSKCRLGEKVKRKPQQCSICRMEGHNKKSCPLAKDIQQQTNATSCGINRNHVEEGLDADAEMVILALMICVPQHINYIIFINKSGN
ncbi:hypothetical protein Ahy_B02g061060 isoform A [Arachis hypogaea]|uniref:Uncharacterized protein n=1 Tax=Arachis hypogaea TaxID=3818 RepID=A0A445AK46_ARAHY|nr:hypothetical protein Ahy_B02g061060 isoform A [Arachis hypogaea]